MKSPTENSALLSEYRVTYINSVIGNSLKRMAEGMRMRDEELFSRFVRDDNNPDYIIASGKCLSVIEDCMRLRDYLHRRKDSIFIFYSGECIDPDLNVFDYGFTWNNDFIFGDRIAHHISYTYGSGINPFRNNLTREEARKILDSNPGFCNFVYSHSNEPRDSYFHLLSQYKRVDSLGVHLRNKLFTGVQADIKSGYKFSMAMENASYKGYTTEKIINSFLAHNVPIYWGDPAVTDFINPKAFINCADYDSFDEVIERVREIDNNDELWIDMVTQPWQTEEQHEKLMRALDENDAFIRHIFTQDIRKARRRPEGFWADRLQANFTGMIGVTPPIYMRAARSVKHMIGRRLSREQKYAVKKFLRMEI